MDGAVTCAVFWSSGVSAVTEADLKRLSVDELLANLKRWAHLRKTSEEVYALTLNSFRARREVASMPLAWVTDSALDVVAGLLDCYDFDDLVLMFGRHRAKQGGLARFESSVGRYQAGDVHLGLRQREVSIDGLLWLRREAADAEMCEYYDDLNDEYDDLELEDEFGVLVIHVLTRHRAFRRSVERGLNGLSVVDAGTVTLPLTSVDSRLRRSQLPVQLLAGLVGELDVDRFSSLRVETIDRHTSIVSPA
ncbi:hypothetical protein [Gordonia rubripertincta]|uniref:hypothetical protein n=1 Tax=Gordonia rubripertincta TaxID=36822 RepID=UPI0015FE3A72|nr:hypothetical protein [Gordonia rubripertincta]QMU20463.1 hypothetical protein H3V45_20920 [Gordonia rubripertincta]